MTKQYLRILCALIGLAGFGVAAQAQTVDRIEVKIPYSFTAGGKVLPAGNYSVRRVIESSGAVLLLSSYETRASVIVVPNQSEGGAVDKVFVSFEQVGDEHFLSAIQTGEYLYTIPVSRKAVMEASLRAHSGATTPAAMSGNN